ncbi:hypothetical protein J6590_076278 [Homalodisca vitripennis]|nr:hypothetical protein J6590_076278 [Homalodisca vitripennis]
MQMRACLLEGGGGRPEPQVIVAELREAMECYLEKPFFMNGIDYLSSTGDQQFCTNMARLSLCVRYRLPVLYWRSAVMYQYGQKIFHKYWGTVSLVRDNCGLGGGARSGLTCRVSKAHHLQVSLVRDNWGQVAELAAASHVGWRSSQRPHMSGVHGSTFASRITGGRWRSSQRPHMSGVHGSTFASGITGGRWRCSQRPHMLGVYGSTFASGITGGRWRSSQRPHMLGVYGSTFASGITGGRWRSSQRPHMSGVYGSTFASSLVRDNWGQVAELGGLTCRVSTAQHLQWRSSQRPHMSTAQHLQVSLVKDNCGLGGGARSGLTCRFPQRLGYRVSLIRDNWGQVAELAAASHVGCPRLNICSNHIFEFPQRLSYRVSLVRDNWGQVAELAATSHVHGSTFAVTIF